MPVPRGEGVRATAGGGLPGRKFNVAGPQALGRLEQAPCQAIERNEPVLLPAVQIDVRTGFQVPGLKASCAGTATAGWCRPVNSYRSPKHAGPIVAVRANGRLAAAARQAVARWQREGLERTARWPSTFPVLHFSVPATGPRAARPRQRRTARRHQPQPRPMPTTVAGGRQAGGGGRWHRHRTPPAALNEARTSAPSTGRLRHRPYLPAVSRTLRHRPAEDRSFLRQRDRAGSRQQKPSPPPSSPMAERLAPFEVAAERRRDRKRSRCSSRGSAAASSCRVLSLVPPSSGRRRHARLLAEISVEGPRAEWRLGENARRWWTRQPPSRP